MILRPFGHSDLSQMRQLIHRTIDVCYTAYPPRAISFFKEYHSESAILERADQGRILVADGDGHLLATGTLLGSEILGVFVASEHQREGLGTAVMDRLETLAVEDGRSWVHLSISLPSLAFYESRGYRVTLECSHDLGDNQSLDYWEAEKQLPDLNTPEAHLRNSYKVVPASSAHVPFLPNIERSAASLFGDAVPSELLEHVTPESDFRAAQEQGMLWVALGADDEPVGFARVIVAGRRVHLAELDVLPEHGRRGIGTALVRTVEHWADSNGFSEITLTTYRDLPWNAPFYIRLGFEVVPESDWDVDMRDRFEMEAGLESELIKRVVMRRGDHRA